MNHRIKPVAGKSFIIILLSVLIAAASVQPCFAVDPVNKYERYKHETITDLLGITRSDIVQWLSSHEEDDYYIGTPYAYRTGDILNDRRVPYTIGVPGSAWGLWPYGNAVYPYVYSPNGDIVEGGVAQMNCGGFVHHVLTHAVNKDGTEDKAVKDQISLLERMFDTSGMGFAGACSFYLAMHGAGVRTYNYQTIDQMLESGILEKGDVIIFDGIGYYGSTYDKFGNYSDWHIGFFWGDEPDENVYWHSTHQTLGRESVTYLNGTVVANPGYFDQTIRGEINDPADKTGSALYGNVISEIKPTSEYVYAIVIKFSGEIEDKNDEADPNGTAGDKERQSILNGLQIIEDAWYDLADPVRRIGWKLINGDQYYFDDTSSRTHYLALYAEKRVFAALLPKPAASVLKILPKLRSGPADP